MKTFSIWLVYDFGLKGDYKALYTWLANRKAKECGNNVAFFDYSAETTNNKELLLGLSVDIHENIKLSPSDRLYVIFKEKNGQGGGGIFINGGRREAPWTGYGQEKIEDFTPEG